MTLPDGAARAFRQVFGTLVPIAFVGVAVYLVHHGQREAYLAERDQRAVAAVRDQIRVRFEAVATVIATDHRSCAKRLEVDCPVAAFPDLETVPRARIRLPRASAAGTRLRVVGTREAAFVYLSYEHGCDRLAAPKDADLSACATGVNACITTMEQGQPFRSCSRIPLEALVGPLLIDGTIFDAIALTIGPVPVALRSPLPMDLHEDLQRALEAGAEVNAASSTLDEVANAERILRAHASRELTLRGEPFRVFTEPILDGPQAHGRDGKADGTLRLHGVVRVKVFAAEAREIPNGWVLVLIVVLVFAGLAWPLLKIWSMSPQERMNGLDIRVLVIAIVFAAGIVTFAILELAGHGKLVERSDAQLGELATSLEGRLGEDLVAAGRTLSGLLEDGEAVDYDDFVQVVQIGRNAEPERMWVPSGNGAVSLREVPAPALTIADRHYYADLVAGRLWMLPSAPELRFAAELVPSKTNGRPTLVLAMASRLTPGTSRLIGMSVSALIRPVLPYGFGFAFLDEDGTVQLHSDSRRNLVENFVDECDGDPRVRAAVAHAPADETTPPIDAMYRGVPHRLVVHRMPGTAWRLVVFRDRRVLDRVNDEVIASWSVLYVTYLGGFLIVLLGAQIAHDGYRAEWLWPDRRRPGLYPAAAVRLGLTAVVALVAVARQPGFARLSMLCAVAAGSMAALCLALAKPRADLLSGGERWLARSTVVVAALVALLLAAHVRDWATVGFMVALGAAWWPAGVARVWQPATEGGFRFAYVAMLVMLLVVLAVIPAAVLWRDAHAQVMAELGRFGRLDFDRRAAERAAEARLREWRANRVPLLVDGRAAAADRGLYPISWPAVREGDGRGTLGAIAGILMARMPDFGPPVPDLRALATDGPASSAPDPVVPRGPAPVRSGMQPITVPGRLPVQFGRSAVIALAAALVVLGFGVLWSIARLLFLLDVDRKEATGGAGPPAGALIVWTLASVDRLVPADGPTESQDVIDLRRPLTPAAKAAEMIELDHLEWVLDTPALHVPVLDLLENLVRVQRKAVILASEVDPLRYLSARVLEARAERASAADAAAAQAAAAAETSAAALLGRWAGLLDVFQRKRWELPPGSGIPEDKRPVAETLQRKYATLTDGGRTPADDVDEACEARHWQLWRQCTRAEKLALRHLAEEGFLNPNAQDVVRPLFRRLLVRRDPAFCLPTEAFRRFVLRAEASDTIASWESSGGPGAWTRLRAPLVSIALLAAAYLLLAEPDAFNWSIALTTGVAAGLPAILKVFSIVGDQRAGAGGR